MNQPELSLKTSPEALEQASEKIAALPKSIVHVMDGTPDEWSRYESIDREQTIAIIDAAIAEERAERECQPDGDKCIGCATPPSGTTCALHGTVASVAESAKPEPPQCYGCGKVFSQHQWLQQIGEVGPLCVHCANKYRKHLSWRAKIEGER